MARVAAAEAQLRAAGAAESVTSLTAENRELRALITASQSATAAAEQRAAVADEHARGRDEAAQALRTELDGARDELRQARQQQAECSRDADAVRRQVAAAEQRAAVAETQVHGRDEVLQSLTPGQHVVRIVRDEMLAMFGGTTGGLPPADKAPRVILMLGLQGSGKTTTSAKLARWVSRQGRHAMLVSTDVRRPAAIEQLSVLAKTVGVRVHDPIVLLIGDAPAHHASVGGAGAKAPAIGGPDGAQHHALSREFVMLQQSAIIRVEKPRKLPSVKPPTGAWSTICP